MHEVLTDRIVASKYFSNWHSDKSDLKIHFTASKEATVLLRMLNNSRISIKKVTSKYCGNK